MKSSKSENFDKVVRAIKFIKDHFKEQPSLEEVSKFVGLSPSHFQRLFSSWAGVSPKKFLHFISIEHAKKLLKRDKLSLLNTSYETGLSSSARLHDMFTNIEGMTPGEYKNGGVGLSIKYSYSETLFGKVMVASTSKGICYMGFETFSEQGLGRLQVEYPNASYCLERDSFQENALLIFEKDWSSLAEIKLHLKATDFQLKVWSSLLKVPMGELVTYSDIAGLIDSPKSSRAVGSAVGKNPIAFLIPCHRVIRSTGEFGGYMWGEDRKCAMIGWEGAHRKSEDSDE